MTNEYMVCDNDDKYNPVEIAKEIAHIQDRVFKKNDCFSRPFGDKWMMVVGSIIREIGKACIRPTQEVVDYLTDWNYHTAANAASIMLQCSEIARYDVAI